MTLDQALRVLMREHVGDFIYDIRERAFSDDPDFKGNTWDHPRVKAWSEAAQVIEQHVKRARVGEHATWAQPRGLGLWIAMCSACGEISGAARADVAWALADEHEQLPRGKS